MKEKEEKIQLTFREVLHYLNGMEEDKDFYVDGIGDGCAVVGGNIRFTPEGLEHFGPALDMKLSGYTIIGSDEDYRQFEAFEDGDTEDGGNLQLAYNLLYALAGYCPSTWSKKWFEGDTAKLI